MEPKTCLQCGGLFYKPINETKKNWINRHKFCSRDCVNQSQKGKPLKNIDYQSRIPWNKGKLYPQITGENHPLWRGNEVSYANLHRWVYRHKGSPQKCEHCKTIEKIKYHWANLSGKYKRNLDDWIRLCVSCHKKYDIKKKGLQLKSTPA